MSKTYELRKVIKGMLDACDGDSYPYNATDDAKFPYKTYTLESIQLGDEADRDDAILTIDVWDYGNNTKRVESIADDIESIFNRANKPNESILPTFYLSNRRYVADQDKKIKRIQIQIQIQSYYVGD